VDHEQPFRNPVREGLPTRELLALQPAMREAVITDLLLLGI